MSNLLKQLQSDFPTLKIEDHTLTYIDEPNTSDVLIFVQNTPSNVQYFDDNYHILFIRDGSTLMDERYRYMVVKKWLEPIECLACYNDLNGVTVACETCGEQLCIECRDIYLEMFDETGCDLCPFCKSSYT